MAENEIHKNIPSFYGYKPNTPIFAIGDIALAKEWPGNVVKTGGTNRKNQPTNMIHIMAMELKVWLKSGNEIPPALFYIMK